MKIVALIPLKGKSKSIPRKNLKMLAGRPLCYWVCEAAAKSKFVEKIYVSTEDAEIAKTVQSFGFNIDIIPEEHKPETKLSVLESVIAAFMTKVSDFDILITLQATNPFTTSDHIDEAIKILLKEKIDSMLTAVLLKRFFWSKDAKPLNYDYLKRPLRQVFEGTYMENGAFYLTKKEILNTYKNRLGGKIGIYEMPEITGLEIDEPGDWEKAEHLLEKFRRL